MRLVNASTREVHEFPGDDATPPFAILSHTWDDEECTLQDMTVPDVEARVGYIKIKYCCDLALEDGLQWAWVDTCCIDKTSTAELSEAINSMFRWYQSAVICYAFLADVPNISELRGSRWFTRGWTLQELIAPRDVRFYSSSWQCLGSKVQLQDQLAQITGIEQCVLATGAFGQTSIARRMSWASRRQTTRVEDLAYSLLGIFDVNMPLLYGEGRKSFTRLQEEIMKISEDQSLFAWGLPATFSTMQEFSRIKFSSETSQLHRLLADSPADFKSSHHIHVLDNSLQNMPPMVYSNGVRIELPVVKIGPIWFAAISCTVKGHYDYYLGIPLLQWSKKFTARCGEVVLLRPGDWPSNSTNLLIKAPVPAPVRPIINRFKIVPTTKGYHDLDDVYCLPHATYSSENDVVDLVSSQAGPHVAFFFSPLHPIPRRRGYNWGSAYEGSFESPFAIVIGGDISRKEGVWAVLVRIVNEESMENISYAVPEENGELIQYRATKSQLISHLNTSQPFPRKHRSPFRDLSYEWCTIKWARANGRKSRNLKIILSVTFKEIPVNLVEKCFAVHVDIVDSWEVE